MKNSFLKHECKHMLESYNYWALLIFCVFTRNSLADKYMVFDKRDLADEIFEDKKLKIS